eukprot:1147345-Pelagomonas_calceolata.AAC.2
MEPSLNARGPLAGTWHLTTLLSGLQELQLNPTLCNYFYDDHAILRWRCMKPSPALAPSAMHAACREQLDPSCTLPVTCEA